MAQVQLDRKLLVESGIKTTGLTQLRLLKRALKNLEGGSDRDLIKKFKRLSALLKLPTNTVCQRAYAIKELQAFVYWQARG